MHWWYGGWWGGGAFMILFWIAVVVGIVWLIRGNSYPQARETDVNRTNLPKETALDILQKRYAAGEISKEEYREMKDELNR